MKKSLILSIIASFLMVSLSTSVASAWHYNLSGSGACQPDGSYKIIWKVDNTSEPSALDIYESSYPAVVPVGKAIVNKFSAKTFNHTVDGTKPATFNLTLKADWEGDRSRQVQSATVKLGQPCEQPKTPSQPQAGQGAGEVLGQQVTVTPVGEVNAGEGTAAINVPALAAGALSAMFCLGLYIVRNNKQRA